MVLGTATSKNGVQIRLTDERWLHITTSHKEIEPDDVLAILDVIGKPDIILRGDTGELLAVKKKPRKKIWIVVAYKEYIAEKDGFVLTAYITTANRWLFQRKVIWNKD